MIIQKKSTLVISLIILAVGSTTIIAYQKNLMNANVLPSTVSNSSNVTDCSYEVFTYDKNVYVKSCDTGLITYKSTDASAAINHAIAAGHKTFIKQGEYTITKPIDLLHGVTLQGESPSQPVTDGNGGTHLRLANSANVNMIQYNGTDKAYMITIEDMFLDGNKKNNAAGNGIYLNNKASDVMIQNVYIDGFPQSGALFDSVWNYRLFGNTFEHNLMHGLVIKAGTDIKIIGNKFMTNYQDGLLVGTDLDGVDAVMLEGNYVQGNGQSGALFQNVQYANIEGNVFQINSYRNTGVYDALLLQNNASYTNVIGNEFLGSSVTRSAIRITHPSARNVMIMDNAMDGFKVSPPIDDFGTNTIIRNNVGYITESKGIATIEKGVTSVIINHGLSYTPTAGEITITPINKAINDIGNLWISNITSKQFTVNVRTDPGASGFTFAWAVRRI
jgi:parallel beta helix pectate lyase-like protein